MCTAPPLLSSGMFGDLTDALTSFLPTAVKIDTPSAPTVGPIASANPLSQFLSPTTSTTQIAGMGLLAVAAYFVYKKVSR